MAQRPPAPPPAKYDAIPQGYGLILPRSPNAHDWIGTDGLTTCLGVYVVLHRGQDENYFISHFDCGVQVGNKNDPNYQKNYQKIVDRTAQILANLLGNYDSGVHDRVLAVSPLADKSTFAMLEGLKKWMGNDGSEVFKADGFRVKYDGGPPIRVIGADTAIPIKVPGQANCRIEQ